MTETQELILDLGDTRNVGKYTTGWCMSGGHEGKMALNAFGSRIPNCRGVYVFPRIEKPFVCLCWCHDLWRQARAQLGALSPSAPSDVATVTESAASGDPVPVKSALQLVMMPMLPPIGSATRSVYEKLYDDTFLTVHLDRFLIANKLVKPRSVAVERVGMKHGERVRGSLAVNVETVCRLIEDGSIPIGLDKATPETIALFADPDYPISRGAITNILTDMRDTNLCLLVVERPLRFNGFIGEAKTMTLSEIGKRKHLPWNRR